MRTTLTTAPSPRTNVTSNPLDFLQIYAGILFSLKNKILGELEKTHKYTRVVESKFQHCTRATIGRLRSVGSLHIRSPLQKSTTKETKILQKRPITYMFKEPTNRSPPSIAINTKAHHYTHATVYTCTCRYVHIYI